MGSDDEKVRDKAMAQYARLEVEFEAQGGYAAESEAAAIASALNLEERILDTATRHPLRRSAPPGRAVANPLLRQRDPAARRADQPPRRRLDRLAARVSPRLQGRAHHHQPRRRDARCRRQQGLPPRREPLRPRRLQRQLEDLPPGARDRREAPQARARQRDEEGRCPHGAGRQDACQGDQGDRRPEHGQARRAAPRRGRGRAARPTRWPSCASRSRPPCGKTPLRASGLSRSYGSLEVFTDVDLAIDRGTKVVVLGLNGAGKTTLLRMLAGVDAPDTGQVEPGTGSPRLLRPGAREPRRRAAPSSRT